MGISVLNHAPQERRSHYQCYPSSSPGQQAHTSIIPCFPDLFCTQQIKPSPPALKTWADPRHSQWEGEHFSQCWENITDLDFQQNRAQALLSLAHQNEAEISTVHVEFLHQAELCHPSPSVTKLEVFSGGWEPPAVCSTPLSSPQTSQLPQHLLHNSCNRFTVISPL